MKKTMFALIVITGFNIIAAPPCVKKAIKATLKIANMNSAPTNPMFFSSLTPAGKPVVSNGKSILYSYNVHCHRPKN